MKLSMKPHLALQFILLCSLETVRAQDPTDISSELAGLIKGSPAPSIAAAAILEGKLVSQGATGLRKIRDNEKVTVIDKYHIGSCTKSMTAVLAAIMVESGKVKWDTTISEIFSGLDIHKDYKMVTLRQLLSNSGGVPGDIAPKLWRDLWDAKGSPKEQRKLLLKGILEEKPAYQPGSKQVYSNAGFSIAGAMIETVAGDSYEELLARLVFKPLGMDSAGFRAPATHGKVDQPYGHSKSGSGIVSNDPEPQGDNPSAIAPAGAVHCSIIDFAKYARFHLGDSDAKLISDESRELLHTPMGGSAYSMGWIVAERPWAGGKALTHAGSNTMFYAVIWIAPRKNFAAVAMCNYGGKEGFEKCDEAIALLIKKHL
jgi:CubicO group peptidase (beta-lactamase class C family)